MQVSSNLSAHTDKQLQVAASRRVLRAVGLGRHASALWGEP